MYELYLAHHGVLGMKWGVRRYQSYSTVPRKSGNVGKEIGEAKKWKNGRADNKKRRYSYARKGGTIEKGSKVMRIAVEEKDPTYGDKKHVSVTKSDHKKWNRYLTPANEAAGRSVYEKEYTAISDIKVASDKEVGKVFYDKFIRSEKADVSMKAVMESQALANRVPAYRNTYIGSHVDKSTASIDATLNVAFQTETGKAFVNEMWKQGYGAISDAHGRNNSRDPLIILKPDRQMIETNSKKISRR